MRNACHHTDLFLPSPSRSWDCAGLFLLCLKWFIHLFFSAFTSVSLQGSSMIHFLCCSAGVPGSPRDLGFFYRISCKIPFKIILNYNFLIFFSFFQLKKKLKSNSLLKVWNALRPSKQPTVSPNYSQSKKMNIRPSDGRTIVLSTHCPTVLDWRLLDFRKLL